MSKYKDQLKYHFEDMELKASKILSVGGQEDDKNYFAKVDCDEFIVLDNNRDHNPQILFDMNRSLQGDGSFDIDEKYMEYFDVALVLNLWEYIYDPLQGLRNLADMIKPGGRLITNFPFIYPVHNPPGQDFMRYTPEGAEKLLTMAGFKIVAHDHIVGNILLKTYYQMDGLKARGGFDHTVIGSIIEATKG